MYNTKFENVPDIFGAPGLAAVMVAVKMLARLGIASFAIFSGPGRGPGLVLVRLPVIRSINASLRTTPTSTISRTIAF